MVRAMILTLLIVVRSALAIPPVKQGIGFLSRLRILDLSSQGRPGMRNVTLHWYNQTIDHFSWAPTPTGQRIFQQRYLVNDAHWRKGGPIFFYCGNEANVELYVNATGLMWENAKEFGAALVFAEHRYYGKSLPFGQGAPKRLLHYLTAEQALADYAQLLHDLKRSWGTEDSAVIAFGGSYGGMLAAWLRMKYPGAVDGAISASAPILAFPSVKGRDWRGEAFWQVVTRDATTAAGSAPRCASNVRRAWREMFALGRTEGGRRQLEGLFRLCDERPLKTQQDVTSLALMHLNAFDSLAMGNYPYPSNYLVFQETHDPSVLLPAFPMQTACNHMAGSLNASFDLLTALRDATGVFYNATGTAQCFKLPVDPNFDGIWDYQFCTEMQPQETYFSRDGVQDMFWPLEQNLTAINCHCRASFGVEPRPEWIAVEFAGAAGASNIVFSNGLYDPWSSGGVLRSLSASVVAVIIPEGAHHLDLMFSNPQDPPSVRKARKEELAHIRGWIAAKADSSAALIAARDGRRGGIGAPATAPALPVGQRMLV